jgi:putative membrane protein (TIGR04086 family)
MQENSKEAGTAPPRIEPTGFFTGVQIRPVIIGVVVDYISTQIALAVFVLGYLAKKFSSQGDLTEEAIAKYMETPEGLTALLVIGCLGTALGGFIAARRAASLETKHGAFVGLGSLMVSFIQRAMQQESIQLPEWFNFLSIVAVIPAGALGGYLAQLLRSGGKSVLPGGPIP